RKRHAFEPMALGDQRGNVLLAFEMMIDGEAGWDPDMNQWLRAARDAFRQNDITAAVHYMMGAIAQSSCMGVDELLRLRALNEERLATNKRRGHRGKFQDEFPRVTRKK